MPIRTVGVPRRFYIEDVRLHAKGVPWIIRDRKNGDQIVETCHTRQKARMQLSLLNGRVAGAGVEGQGSQLGTGEARRL